MCMAVTCIKPQTSILQVKPLLAVWRAGEELKERDVSFPQFMILDHLGKSGCMTIFYEPCNTSVVVSHPSSPSPRLTT